MYIQFIDRNFISCVHLDSWNKAKAFYETAICTNKQQAFRKHNEKAPLKPWTAIIVIKCFRFDDNDGCLWWWTLNKSAFFTLALPRNFCVAILFELLLRLSTDSFIWPVVKKFHCNLNWNMHVKGNIASK